jgi:hypothetical protein
MKHPNYLPETKAENDAELERMRELANNWGYAKPDSIYSGHTNEIDLEKDWYCPQCNDGTKLKLHKSTTGRMGKPDYQEHASLACPTHYEKCEYTFTNKAERKRRREWWGAGYQFPLTPQEMATVLIGQYDQKIKDSWARARSATEMAEKLTAERAEFVASKLAMCNA